MKCCTPKILFWSAAFLLFLRGCSQDPLLTSSDDFVRLPAHFPEPHYNNTKNVLTERGVALGKRLFYDPILSLDSSISCGSCHSQAFAFSDNGKVSSIGVRGQVGSRNSPPLFNLLWNKSFMWDGGVNHLEVVSLAPLELAIEMDETIGGVIQKLNSNVTYKKAFKEVFGVDNITDKEFLYAMAQYMSILISAESKYDRVARGQAVFSDQESKGYILYQNNCSSCHTEPLFTNYAFQNNGLDSVFEDLGRKRITLQEADLGKFKVPALRNLGYTSPYMHDGRFATLSQVLDHYSTGILPSPSLAEGLRPMQFSAQQKQELLSFLATLNDENFITNVQFSE